MRYVHIITVLFSLWILLIFFLYIFMFFSVYVFCLTLTLQFFLQRLYKKNAKEGFGKFTAIVDRPEIVLAKINAANLSDVCKTLHSISKRTKGTMLETIQIKFFFYSNFVSSFLYL